MLLLSEYLYFSKDPLCERLREDELYFLLKRTLLFNLPLTFSASVSKITRVEFSWSLWATCSVVWPLLFCKYFSYNLIVILHIAICVCYLLSLYCVSINAFFYKFPLGSWRQHSDAPARLPQTNQTETNPIHSNFLHILVAAHWPHFSMPMSFSYWEAKNLTEYPDVALELPSQKNNHFHWPAVRLLVSH